MSCLLDMLHDSCTLLALLTAHQSTKMLLRGLDCPDQPLLCRVYAREECASTRGALLSNCCETSTPPLPLIRVIKMPPSRGGAGRGRGGDEPGARGGGRHHGRQSRGGGTGPSHRGGRGPCKFGANCNRRETCGYDHPPATTGSRGPCKYGADCRNKEKCPFTHPEGPERTDYARSEKSDDTDDSASVASGITQGGRGRGRGRGRGKGRGRGRGGSGLHPSEIRCRFGFACTRPDCIYKHPIGWQPGAGTTKGVAIVKSKILGPSLVNKMCDYYGDDLSGLEEEVGARVSYLEAECRLKTQVADADATRVEAIFDHAVDTSRARLAKECNEFHLLGSTRAVVGAGLEVLYVLFGNEFHTVVAIEVPNEDRKLSEQTKNKVMQTMGKFSESAPPFVFDSVVGKNSRLHIVFSKAEEAQAALDANPKGPWRALRPYILPPREGTMVQVLKLTVKYPLNPKQRRDPLYILLEQLARFNVKVQDIDIKKKKEKGTGKAYISMASKSDADAAEAQLRVLASIPNELTSQPDNLTIKKDISFQVAVQPWEFTALRPSLEKLAVSNTAVSIQLKEPKPTRNVAIIKLARKGGTGPLSAEEKDNLIKVRTRIEDVLRGRILRFSRDEMQFMRSEKMQEEMKRIMEDEDRETGHEHSLHISVENESSKIRLFGSPSVARNAELMILGLKFSLFEEQPHDLEVSSATRAYLLNGKEDTLTELRDSLQDELDQEIKIKVERATEADNGNAIVKVRATQDAAQEAKMFLRDLHKIASSGQTMRVRSCGGPNPGSTCSILRSPIEAHERHLMEPCLHAYEKETAKAQLNHSLADRKIPVKCSNPGCKPPKPFGLEDCKLLLSNTEFEKGLRQSLLHYLAQHAGELRRCDSEGCLQVYKAGPALFECSHCLEAYCTRCHVKWHAGKTCDQYQAELRAASASAQWLADNTKPCGNCSAPFFKYSGCNHLVCGNCKKDLCNRCGATFDTALATYRHLREAHGGIYD